MIMIKEYDVDSKDSAITINHTLVEYNAKVVTPMNDRMLLINVRGCVYKGYYSVKNGQWYLEAGVSINEEDVISFFDMPETKFYTNK